MSSNLLGLYKTPSMAIYESTCLNLITQVSEDLLEDRPINESFTSINGLDKCVEEIRFSKPIQDLFEKYHDPKTKRKTRDRDRNRSGKAYENWNSIMEIMKVGDFDQSIKDGILLANSIHKDEPEDFYGILMISAGRKNTRTVFNPLHPLIISELIRENTTIDIKQKSWTIAVYAFKQDQKKDFLQTYPQIFSNFNYIDEIVTLLASVDTPSEYIVENKNFKVDIENDQFVLNYDEIKKLKENGEVLHEEKSNSKSFIVPCQIINVGGVAYPYYGTIYSTRGLAWNMTPMQSANINHSEGQTKQSGMAGGSRICTHSGNSKTQMGISSLNHSNTTSPLNSDCMEDGSMTYAAQCISVSLEIFLDKLGIAEENEQKTFTYQEFVTENDGATKAQYIQYIKGIMQTKLEADEDEEEIQKHEETTTEPTYPIFNHLNTYGIGDITVDNHGNNPKILVEQPDGGTSWIEHKHETPKLYNPSTKYSIGDIVLESDGTLSQLIEQQVGNIEWKTYIPPIDLTEIEITPRETGTTPF